MRALVVGGGIGGLTTAIVLAREGHEVTLVERRPSFGPIGAGIVLGANALLVLEALGIDVSHRGQALPSLEVLDARGRRLSEVAPSRVDPGVPSFVALARPDLHEVLLAAVPAGVDVRLGIAVGAVTTGSGSARVVVDGKETPFDVVVGADGAHSHVRTAVLGPVPLRYSGTTCFRGLTPNPGFTGAAEAWCGASRIGIVPLRSGQLYYYLVRTAKLWSPPPRWPDGFQALFGGIGGPLGELVGSLAAAPPLHHDLNELDRPIWGRGRVLLLGDAAHAMTPNQGQGAAMAIEDAFALGLALRGPSETWLARYAALRHARVRRMQLESRWIGVVAHLENPWLCAVRDALLRRTPQSAQRAQVRALVAPARALLGAP